MTVWDSMALNAPHTEREIGNNVPRYVTYAEYLEWREEARELAQDGEPDPGSTTEPENATCQPAGVSEPLLPCPFCGGEAVYTSRNGSPGAWEMDEMHWVYCSSQDCLADFGMCETAEEAIAGWNRRPASQSQAILSAIAAEKAEWPHAGSMHDGARMACDNIAARIKQLMGDA